MRWIPVGRYLGVQEGEPEFQLGFEVLPVSEQAVAAWHRVRASLLRRGGLPVGDEIDGAVLAELLGCGLLLDVPQDWSEFAGEYRLMSTLMGHRVLGRGGAGGIGGAAGAAQLSEYLPGSIEYAPPESWIIEPEVHLVWTWCDRAGSLRELAERVGQDTVDVVAAGCRLAEFGAAFFDRAGPGSRPSRAFVLEARPVIEPSPEPGLQGRLIWWADGVRDWWDRVHDRLAPPERVGWAAAGQFLGADGDGGHHIRLGDRIHHLDRLQFRMWGRALTRIGSRDWVVADASGAVDRTATTAPFDELVAAGLLLGIGVSGEFAHRVRLVPRHLPDHEDDVIGPPRGLAREVLLFSHLEPDLATTLAAIAEGSDSDPATLLQALITRTHGGLRELLQSYAWLDTV
ncbi:hypothetical protein [Streptomyces sp. NPDC058045]|uniref:hypothetical protein n=1 Tax=Streptomyces sp. NPDC058045 TaxID=3346311 RepID=UPI0036ECE48C